MKHCQRLLYLSAASHPEEKKPRYGLVHCLWYPDEGTNSLYNAASSKSGGPKLEPTTAVIICTVTGITAICSTGAHTHTLHTFTHHSRETVLALCLPHAGTCFCQAVQPECKSCGGKLPKGLSRGSFVHIFRPNLWWLQLWPHILTQLCAVLLWPAIQRVVWVRLWMLLLVLYTLAQM